jgi:hypothetical protein
MKGGTEILIKPVPQKNLDVLHPSALVGGLLEVGEI